MLIGLLTAKIEITRNIIVNNALNISLFKPISYIIIFFSLNLLIILTNIKRVSKYNLANTNIVILPTIIF